MSQPASGEAYAALCGLGPDRPGLVAAVSAFVTERGANVVDSRMAVLGAEFGTLLLIAGSEAKLTALQGELAGLEAETGMTFLYRPTKSPEDHRRAASRPYRIFADALDHEGIVNAVSRRLHALGINVVSFRCTSYQAPVTGSPLFRLQARVDVPGGVPVSQLHQALDEVAEEENLDIEVKPIR